MRKFTFSLATPAHTRQTVCRDELEQALEQLKNKRDYVLLQPEEPLNGCVFLKATLTPQGYQMETCITDGESLTHFRGPCGKQALLDTFLNLYDITALPDIRGWEVVTSKG